MQKKLISLKKYLIGKKIASDTESAENLVKSGKVTVNKQIVCNPDSLILFNSNIEIAESSDTKENYVSRGGLKIEKAFEEFKISVKNKSAVDIGASTGGFTDFMLKNGAVRITAVDVGYGIISWKLRNDPRINLLERTNIRNLDSNTIGYYSDFTVADVSFISLRTIFNKILELTGEGGEILLLVKPQFEAKKNAVEEKGLITKIQTHTDTLKEIFDFILNNKLKVKSLTFSKLKGAKGNIEFWIYLKKNFIKKEINLEKTKKNYDKIINETVNSAHDYFRKL